MVVLKRRAFPFFCISDDAIAEKNMSEHVQRNDCKVTFRDDAVVTIDEDQFTPKLLSISVKHFINSCGMDLLETFKRAESAQAVKAGSLSAAMK